VSTEPILVSISAVYSGGIVSVKTDITELSDLTVTANYSDESTKVITDYELIGEILNGDNEITVKYEDKTTKFVVVGVDVESFDIHLNASVSFSSGSGLTIANRTDRATTTPVAKYLVKNKTYTFNLTNTSNDYYSYGIQIMKT